MTSVVKEFYGQPERAVPFLILLSTLVVAWFTRSSAWTVIIGLLLSFCWRYWSARLVIDDTRLGHVTLTCPTFNGTGQPQVWLTFDDGPDEETLGIVEILNVAGRPATFFFIGDSIRTFERGEELYGALRAGGHSVANHTLHHSNLLKLTREEIEVEILENQHLLENHFPGLTVPLFRPPFGYRNPQTIDLMSEHQLDLVGWSLNSLDFLAGSWREIFDRVQSQLQPGAILLFHDGGGDRSNTSSALPSLITLLEDRDFGAYTPR